MKNYFLPFLSDMNAIEPKANIIKMTRIDTIESLIPCVSPDFADLMPSCPILIISKLVNKKPKTPIIAKKITTNVNNKAIFLSIWFNLKKHIMIFFKNITLWVNPDNLVFGLTSKATGDTQPYQILFGGFFA